MIMTHWLYIVLPKLRIDYYTPLCVVVVVGGGDILEALCPSCLSVCPILSRWYLLNCSVVLTKLGLVLYYHEIECYAEKLVCYVQDEGHSNCLCNQNVSSKLLVHLQPDLVYSIISWSVLWKNWITAFTGKIQWSGWYLLSLLNFFFFFTRLGMMMQHHEPERRAEMFFAIFKDKVTARAHLIKIWFFLLYLLNWFFGNQTLSDDTSS